VTEPAMTPAIAPRALNFLNSSRKRADHDGRGEGAEHPEHDVHQVEALERVEQDGRRTVTAPMTTVKVRP